MPETCGDYGGETQSGTSCDRPAGWGVEGEKKGKCSHHRDNDQTQITSHDQSKHSQSVDEGNSEGVDWEKGISGCLVLLVLIWFAPYVLGIGLALIFSFAVPLTIIGILGIPFAILFGILD